MPPFRTLPAASFIVNGAPPVPNSALASAGAELRFLNGWAIGGRFDGEFADRAQTYAGAGTLRYVWSSAHGVGEPRQGQEGDTRDTGQKQVGLVALGRGFRHLDGRQYGH